MFPGDPEPPRDTKQAEGSFAFEFAKHCGFATQIVSARMGYTGIASYDSGNSRDRSVVVRDKKGVEERVTKVWNSVGKTRETMDDSGPWKSSKAEPRVQLAPKDRAEWDKVLFVPDASSTPQNGVNPQIRHLVADVYPSAQ